jgi:hypothetical protein
MKIKIKIIRSLDEISSVSGGSSQGYGAPFGSPEGIDAFNKEQERDQRLKGDSLIEMFSSQGIAGRNMQQVVSPEKEFAGHLERSQHQGLQNFKQPEKIRTFKIKIKRHPRK